MSKSIKIEVNGGIEEEVLSNEAGYNNLREEYRVTCLKNITGQKIRDFGSLVDGGTYKLGPPVLQPAAVAAAPASLRPPVHPNFPAYQVPTMNHIYDYGSNSSASRADTLERNAQEIAKISTFEPVEGKEAILDEAKAQKLESIAGEKKICAFLFNAMNSCLNDRAVVDSQDFPWLSQGRGHPLKPDGFIVHKALAKLRDSSTKEVKAKTRALVNGTPVDERYVEDEVFIIEGKLGLTLKGQLELVDYMNLVGRGVYRGMLIGKNGFWLVKACNWSISERIEGKWTDGGSVELIRDFLPPMPLACAIDRACEQLGCRISNADTGKSYLGSGASGHVFLVEKGPKKMAMKLSLGSEAYSVRLESSKLLCYNERGDADDLPLAKRDDEYSDDQITAFLMEPVGEPVIPMKNKKGAGTLVQHAFGSLLKLHKASICHGDPRLENLISSGERFIWVDLLILSGRECCNTVSMQGDFFALAKSFLQHLNIGASHYNSIGQKIVDDYDGSIAGANRVIKCLSEIIDENWDMSQFHNRSSHPLRLF